MTLETMVIFSVALSVAAMLPGPGIFAMVARALGSGFWPAVPMAVGMILGDLIFLALVVLGLATVAHQLGGVLHRGEIHWSRLSDLSRMSDVDSTCRW